jgi:hypothetical protein
MLSILLSALLLAQTPAPPASQPDELDEERREVYGIGGDFDWSLSNAGDSSLNLTPYLNDVTRLLRISLLFSFRPSERLGVYVNLTSENADRPFLYGAFVRLAPWGGEKLWLQAGRIPPPFGAFPERWYAAANPLIGYPLLYHHATSLRADNLPQDSADLLSQRGNGRSSRFSGGGVAFPSPGMPMVSLFRWDTGLVGFGRVGKLEYLAGVTNGTLASPRVVDQNDGKQILGRVRFRPHPSFNAGLSAASGAYLDRQLTPHLGGRALEDFGQTTVGVDAEFARGHLLLYGEGGWSRWETPNVSEPLAAYTGFLEARYRLWPGLYLAGRLDRMSFSKIRSPLGERAPWDYPLSRTEFGAGYSFEKRVVLKLTAQLNRFDQADALDEDIVAFQIAVHF